MLHKDKYLPYYHYYGHLGAIINKPNKCTRDEHHFEGKAKDIKLYCSIFCLKQIEHTKWYNNVNEEIIMKFMFVYLFYAFNQDYDRFLFDYIYMIK